MSPSSPFQGVLSPLNDHRTPHAKSAGSKVSLVSPYVPLSSIVANRTENMYVLASPVLEWTYEIGTMDEPSAQSVRIGNITLNVSLQVSVELPSIVQADGRLDFILNPGEAYAVHLTFNLLEAGRRASQGISEYDELILVHVVPINVSGPVYINENPTQFIDIGHKINDFVPLLERLSKL